MELYSMPCELPKEYTIILGSCLCMPCKSRRSIQVDIPVLPYSAVDVGTIEVSHHAASAVKEIFEPNDDYKLYLNAIKEYRNITNTGLRDAKIMVDELMGFWGIDRSIYIGGKSV
jgi:hypothetical protein